MLLFGAHHNCFSIIHLICRSKIHQAVPVGDETSASLAEEITGLPLTDSRSSFGDAESFE